jgi:hypothetical protein
MMNSKPIIDGGRQRCTDCGHPRTEHSRTEHSHIHTCTVPKCACPGYKLPEQG